MTKIRGRKAREVTSDMIEDLTTISKDEFCTKYNCGEAFFLKAYYNNVKVTEKRQESIVDFLPSINILIDKGTIAYLKYLQDRNSHYDKAICDIHHKIELDSCNNGERIVIHSMLGEMLTFRRKYKDAYAFANANIPKLTTYFNLMKEINSCKKSRSCRIYSTRVLVDEFGKTLGN